ncbi:uncharacterized protein [Medicago truncatula]|uniref:uncharacterized protein n=1 Tax=Medicago truncatula TaxID=3880 RepID=UPI0019673CC3|nr:uncharacterized protein LOC120579549 [Medicago truncatula]
MLGKRGLTVGEAETEDIQDQHVVHEENGAEDQANGEDVVGETAKEDIQDQPNVEEIPDLNAATTDVMFGDDTEDDEFDDDNEAEEGYDAEFDYYDAAMDDENSGDELEDVVENDVNVPMDDGNVSAENANVPMAENYANVNVDDASENDDINSYKFEELNSPISSDEEGNGRAVFPQFNPAAQFGQIQFEVGMEFDTLMTFKDVVKDYIIFYGRNIKWAKNDKDRARAKCAQDECKWEIYCSWSKVNQSFQVKTYYSEHTCCRGFKNKQATRKWVVSKLQHQIKIQPSITYSECFDYLQREFGIHVNDSKLFREIKEARELVEGNLREQYGRLWDYSHEIKRSNPSSSCFIDTIPIPNATPQFQRIYICLDSCKKGFKAGCRPFIWLDGCFLKGYYGGQLLAAVGQDANNQIFVIAYAIVDVENKDNWKWFQTLLHDDLGNFREHGWNFMSDMQKGLIPAMQEVMPGVHHRYCAMHLWRNFTKQWKDKELRGAVWACAKATTPAQFNLHMERVKRKSVKAWEYLNKWIVTSWRKSHFSEWPKVDNITNNTCKVFNAKILKFRAHPILTMAKEIRCYIMKTMATNKLKLESRAGALCPMQQSRLDKEKLESNKWTPI